MIPELKKHHVRNGSIVAAIAAATSFLTELGANVAGVAGTDPGSEISLVQLGVAVGGAVLATAQHQSIQNDAAADRQSSVEADIARLVEDYEARQSQDGGE